MVAPVRLMLRPPRARTRSTPWARAHASLPIAPNLRRLTPTWPTKQSRNVRNSARRRERQALAPRSGSRCSSIRAGALTEDQVADALVVATIAGRTLLGWQADAPPGTVAWQLEQAPNHTVEVHQATGRISVRAGISLDDALVLLRAYAFSHDRPIGEVAAAIAAGHLRID